MKIRRARRSPLTPSVAAVVVGILLVALTSIGCGGNAEKADSEPTVTDAAPTIIEASAGRYTGEYRFVSPARSEVYGLKVEIRCDGSLELAAETREGVTVKLIGRLSVDGTLSASGRAAEGTSVITLDGGVVVEGGVVSLRGSWQTSEKESGTWTAQGAGYRTK